jgi:DNA modification methylase
MHPTPTVFEQWTQKRVVSCIGTNAGSAALPFQRWKHFKEAFVPELIERACSASDRKVKRCLDPFGGSGTSALACQFLGVHATTIEVNPFLADLIEAKLTSYSANQLAK